MWNWALENTVVCIVLAVGVAAVCSRIRSRPAVCHFLWLIVLARLVSPPLHVPSWPPDGVRDRIDFAAASIARWLGPVEPAKAPPGSSTLLARMPEGEPRDTGPDFASTSWISTGNFPAKPRGIERGSGRLRRTLTVPLEFPFEEPDRELPFEAWSAVSTRLVSPDAPVAAPAPADDASAVSLALPAAWVARIPWLLLGAWALGSLVVLVRQLGRTIWYHRRVRATSQAPDDLVRVVQSVAERLDIPAPEVRVLEGLPTPVVWCLGRPVLLWPGVDGREAETHGLRSIVAHELAHLRRKDHWAAWLEMAASVVWWWNPLFTIVRRQRRRYAELSCDAWAISLNPEHRRDYAEALIDVVQRMSTKPLVAPALGASDAEFRDVERRLRMILRERVSCRISPLVGAAAVALTLLVAPSGLLAQSRATRPRTAEDPSISQVSVNSPSGESRELREKAAQCLETGQFKEAAQAYRRLAELEPNDGSHCHYLAFTLIRLGRYDDARAAIERQIARGYRKETGLYNLACASALAGNADGAIEELCGAIEAGFNNVELIGSDPDLDSVRSDPRFAKLVDEAKRRASAERKKAEKSTVKGTRREEIVAAEEEAELEEAEGVEGAEVANEPVAAMDLYRRGDYEGAIRAFEEQVRENAEDQDALYNLACCYSRLGDADRACSYLERAAKAGYSNADWMRKDEDLASVKDDPRLNRIAQRIEDRGVLKMFGAEGWEELREKCESAVAERPDDGVAWHQLGWARLRLGEHEKAVRAFERQDETGFAQPIARYNVACCYAHLGELERAFEWLDRSLDAGYVDVDHAQRDPDFEVIWFHPRFEAFIEKMRERAGKSQGDGKHVKKADSPMQGKEKPEKKLEKKPKAKSESV